MRNLIAFDFSMAKPAAALLIENKIIFYSWPKDLTDNNIKTFKNMGINISSRETIPNNDVVRYDIINADNLSEQIIKDLSMFITKNTIIAFEGSSFSSKGNVTLSLTAWRYLLIYKLSKLIDINNIYTYAPITIKKTAGCSKKGTKKADMIEAFKTLPLEFSDYVRNHEGEFKTKKGNWIAHIDDIVDAYWCLETLRVRVTE